MDNVKKVPDIRFEGFDGEWENTNLGMVASEYDYGLGVESKKFDGLNKYLRITDIDDRSRKFSKLDLKSPKFRDKTNERYILTERDIVFARTGASTGKTYLYDKRDGIVYFAGFLVRAKVNNNNSPEFVFYKTLSNEFNKFIKVTSQRSGQPGINAEEYKSFIFKKTSFKEQVQIGNFFKKLDEKLELEKEKHEKLINFKKAMLEDMFPKEGEKVPKVRFDGFDDEWNVLQLKDLGQKYTSLTGKTKNDFGHGDGRYVTFSNVLANPISLIDGVEKIEVDNSQNAVKFGDLFFNISSETYDEVGMSSVWTYDVENYYLNSFCMGFRPSVKMDNHCMTYLLRSRSVRKQIMKLAQGISRINISQNKMMDIFLCIPSLEEQALIGNLFKNLDEKIELSEKKIVKIENFKKAMLDKMFV